MRDAMMVPAASAQVSLSPQVSHHVAGSLAPGPPACFVCGQLHVGRLPLFSRQIVDAAGKSLPFFPFLESHIPPAGAAAPTAISDPSSDGRASCVLSCDVCYTMLLQQWDAHEAQRTPVAKRSYWLKRIDGVSFNGLDLRNPAEDASATSDELLPSRLAALSSTAATSMAQIPEPTEGFQRDQRLITVIGNSAQSVPHGSNSSNTRAQPSTMQSLPTQRALPPEYALRGLNQLAMPQGLIDASCDLRSVSPARTGSTQYSQVGSAINYESLTRQSPTISVAFGTSVEGDRDVNKATVESGVLDLSARPSAAGTRLSVDDKKRRQSPVSSGHLSNSFASGAPPPEKEGCVVFPANAYYDCSALNDMTAKDNDNNNTIAYDLSKQTWASSRTLASFPQAVLPPITSTCPTAVSAASSAPSTTDGLSNPQTPPISSSPISHCFVCGKQALSSSLLNVFAKPIANCPYYPDLLQHRGAGQPANSVDHRSGRVKACKSCHAFLLQQWDSYQRRNVPHSERHYRLLPLTLGEGSSGVGSSASVFTGQPLVECNGLPDQRDSAGTQAVNARTLQQHIINSAGTSSQVLTGVHQCPSPVARVPQQQACSHAAAGQSSPSLFACLTCGNEISSAAGHFRRVATTPRYIQSASSSSAVSEPYFSFLRHLKLPPRACPLDSDGHAVICPPCYKNLLRQYRVFEISHVPEQQRNYKVLVNSDLADSNHSEAGSSASNSPAVSLARKQAQVVKSSFSQQLLHGHSHAIHQPLPVTIVEMGDKQQSRGTGLVKPIGTTGSSPGPSGLNPLRSRSTSGPRYVGCYICEKILPIEQLISVDTRPPSDCSNVVSGAGRPFFPIIENVPRPIAAKPMDADGRALLCSDCRNNLMLQWNTFEASGVAYQHRVYQLRSAASPTPPQQHDQRAQRQQQTFVHPQQVGKSSGNQSSSLRPPVIALRVADDSVVDQVARSSDKSAVMTSGDVIVTNTSGTSAALGPPSSSPSTRTEEISDSEVLENATSVSSSTSGMSNSFRPPSVSSSLSSSVSSPAPTTFTPSGSPSASSFRKAIVTTTAPTFSSGAHTSSAESSIATEVEGLDLKVKRSLPSSSSVSDRECFFCLERTPRMFTICSRPTSDRMPFFPLIERLLESRANDTASVDTSPRGLTAVVCSFCYHSLVAQWDAYEVSPHPEDGDRASRVYNVHDYICYICGILTYRRRVRAITVADFPFVISHPRPDGALQLQAPSPPSTQHRSAASSNVAESVVTCLTCYEGLTNQWRDFERLRVPLGMRKYNWITKPPPPEQDDGSNATGPLVCSSSEGFTSAKCVMGARLPTTAFDTCSSSAVSQSSFSSPSSFAAALRKLAKLVIDPVTKSTLPGGCHESRSLADPLSASSVPSQGLLLSANTGEPASGGRGTQRLAGSISSVSTNDNRKPIDLTSTSTTSESLRSSPHSRPAAPRPSSVGASEPPSRGFQPYRGGSSSSSGTSGSLTCNGHSVVASAEGVPSASSSHGSSATVLSRPMPTYDYPANQLLLHHQPASAATTNYRFEAAEPASTSVLYDPRYQAVTSIATAPSVTVGSGHGTNPVGLTAVINKSHQRSSSPQFSCGTPNSASSGNLQLASSPCSSSHRYQLHFDVRKDASTNGHQQQVLQRSSSHFQHQRTQQRDSNASCSSSRGSIIQGTPRLDNILPGVVNVASTTIDTHDRPGAARTNLTEEDQWASLNKVDHDTLPKTSQRQQNFHLRGQASHSSSPTDQLLQVHQHFQPHPSTHALTIGTTLDSSINLNSHNQVTVSSTLTAPQSSGHHIAPAALVGGIQHHMSSKFQQVTPQNNNKVGQCNIAQQSSALLTSSNIGNAVSSFSSSIFDEKKSVMRCSEEGMHARLCETQNANLQQHKLVKPTVIQRNGIASSGFYPSFVPDSLTGSTMPPCFGAGQSTSLLSSASFPTSYSSIKVPALPVGLTSLGEGLQHGGLLTVWPGATSGISAGSCLSGVSIDESHLTSALDLQQRDPSIVGGCIKRDMNSFLVSWLGPKSPLVCDETKLCFFAELGLTTHKKQRQLMIERIRKRQPAEISCRESLDESFLEIPSVFWSRLLLYDGFDEQLREERRKRTLIESSKRKSSHRTPLLSQFTWALGLMPASSTTSSTKTAVELTWNTLMKDRARRHKVRLPEYKFQSSLNVSEEFDETLLKKARIDPKSFAQEFHESVLKDTREKLGYKDPGDTLKDSSINMSHSVLVLKTEGCISDSSRLGGPTIGSPTSALDSTMAKNSNHLSVHVANSLARRTHPAFNEALIIHSPDESLKTIARSNSYCANKLSGTFSAPLTGYAGFEWPGVEAVLTAYHKYHELHKSERSYLKKKMDALRKRKVDLESELEAIKRQVQHIEEQGRAEANASDSKHAKIQKLMATVHGLKRLTRAAGAIPLTNGRG